MSRVHNPYGDGHASARISTLIHSFLYIVKDHFPSALHQAWMLEVKVTAQAFRIRSQTFGLFRRLPNSMMIKRSLRSRKPREHVRPRPCQGPPPAISGVNGAREGLFLFPEPQLRDRPYGLGSDWKAANLLPRRLCATEKWMADPEGNVCSSKLSGARDGLGDQGSLSTVPEPRTSARPARKLVRLLVSESCGIPTVLELVLRQKPVDNNLVGERGHVHLSIEDGGGGKLSEIAQRVSGRVQITVPQLRQR